MHNFGKDLPTYHRKNGLLMTGSKEKVKEVEFLELDITVRASSIEHINGLLPVIVKDFLLKQDKDKIGTWSSDTCNFCWQLNSL